MQVSARDRRLVPLLAMLALGLILALRFRVFSNDAAAVVAPSDSIPAAEKRLERLRQIAATVPGKEAVMKQAAGELEPRERGMLKAETSAQAQAQLQDMLHRLGQLNVFDVHGVEDLRIRVIGDYGEA